MKLAAIFIPLTLFLLPTIIEVYIALRHGAKEMDPFKSFRKLTAERRKKFMALFCLYWCVFAASISWAAYVFSNNIWLSVLIGLIWIAPISIAMLTGTRRATKLSEPPPEGYPDSKTELDALNKRVDIASEHFNTAFMKWMKRYFKFVVLPLLIVLIILIILGIIAAISS